MMLKQPQIFKLTDTIFKNEEQHTGAVLWLVKTRYSTLKVGASLS